MAELGRRRAQGRTQNSYAFEVGLQDEVHRQVLVGMQQYLDVHGGAETTASKACPKCGKLGRVRRQSVRRKVRSLHGELFLRRHYHYCGACKAGWYPLDIELGLPAEGEATARLEQVVLDLGLHGPFEEAAERFAVHHRGEISENFVRRVIDRVGRRAEGRTDLAESLRAPATEVPSMLVVQVDGSMVPTRGKDPWREVKVGLVARGDQILSIKARTRPDYRGALRGPPRRLRGLQEAAHRCTRARTRVGVQANRVRGRRRALGVDARRRGLPRRGSNPLSSDGSTLAVGALAEASNATGVGGSQTDNSASGAGAVYVFTRAGSTWSQQAYIKASNTDVGDNFGSQLALSSDGSTLAVGAISEDSAAAGVGGDQADNSASGAGAVYVFTRAGSSWSQQAYLKASNTDAFDEFGGSIALSSDGSTLAVGAVYEESNATGIGGNQTDDSAARAGAVYVFTRAGLVWSQLSYVKASNTNRGDGFGSHLAVSSDGFALAVGASDESSNATGVDGDQTINSASSAGAVYVY